MDKDWKIEKKECYDYICRNKNAKLSNAQCLKMNKVINYVFLQFGKNTKFVTENDYPKLCAYIICLMGAIMQFLEMDDVKDENVTKNEFKNFASL